MEIRRASEADAEAISEVLRLAFAEFEPHYRTEGFEATTISADWVLSRLPDGPVWVAVEDGMIVGTASAMNRDGDCFVRGIAVRPEARGRGIAYQLLLYCEAFAVSQGCRLMSLTSTPFLTDAVALYEHFGFVGVGEPLDLFGTPLFRMEKQVEIKR